MHTLFSSVSKAPRSTFIQLYTVFRAASAASVLQEEEEVKLDERINKMGDFYMTTNIPASFLKA